MMMMTFITQGGEGRGNTSKKSKASKGTKSKGCKAKAWMMMMMMTWCVVLLKRLLPEGAKAENARLRAALCTLSGALFY